MQLSDDNSDISTRCLLELGQAIQRELSEANPKNLGDVGSGQVACAGKLRWVHAALSGDVVDAADEFRLLQM